jgi:fucose permease
MLQVVPRAVTRYSSRTVTRWGATAACAAVVLLGLARSVYALAAALLLLGLAFGALDMALNTQGVAIERRYGRPILSGLHAVYSVGTLAGALVGSGAAQLEISPLAHFAAIAAVLLALCWVRSGALLGAEADAATGAAAGHDPVVSPRLRSYPGLVMLGLVALCSFFAEGAVDNWSGIYLHETLHSSLAAAPLAAAAFAIGMTAGRASGDALVSRWGRTATMTRAAALAGAGAMLPVVAGSSALAILGYAILGLGSGAIVPLAFGLAGNVPGIAPAWAMSRVTTLGYIGFVASPPVMGFVAQATSLRAGFALLIPLMLAVVLIAVRLQAPAHAAPVPARR